MKEYKRISVSVTLENGTIQEAFVYVWVAGEEHLSDHDWDFEEFKRNKQRDDME